MTPVTILRYLLGAAPAIREAASSRVTFPTGLVLVLCTAVARNYDQDYWLDSPFWTFGPLLFSLISGTWLYTVLRRSFFSRQADPSEWVAWMGVFWMTAPIAWIYAIPVERFLDRTDAARANAVLLGIVSLWRVILITRAVAVIRSVPFLRVLPLVLLAAAVETLVVSGFTGVLGRRIAASMMGMRNAPEDEIVFKILSWAFNGSLIALVPICVAALVATQGHDFQGAKCFGDRRAGKMPARFLVACVVSWALIAILPQNEILRNKEVEELSEQHRYAEAIRYMSQRRPRDFCPSKRLPPDPFSQSAFYRMPGFLSALDGTEAPWVREHLLAVVSEMLGSVGKDGNPWLWRHSIGSQPKEWLLAFQTIRRLPEGREWGRRNHEALPHLLREEPGARIELPEDVRKEFEAVISDLAGVP